LTEVRGYDWQFPAERNELEEQFRYLSQPPTEETQRILAAFHALPVDTLPVKQAWLAPETFLQSFTAHLWQVHATEQFRTCGEAYGSILTAIRERCTSPANRLAIVLIGRDARKVDTPLFAKLRKHGTYFAHLDDTHLMEEVNAILEERSSHAREPYSHWLIDGGSLTGQLPKPYACISYQDLQPVRDSLAKAVQSLMRHDDVGPEKVRSYMLTLQPADLPGFPREQDQVLQHFAVRVLCDGSGTQNLSTSFVQWSAREVLRRAQPATLVARFAPRSRSTDFLDAHAAQAGLDAEGALIDGDMGAYYTWLNLRRLPCSERSCFIAIAENGQGAVAIGPGMSAGAIATNQVTLPKVLTWMNS
jgi:hypothetical protein